MFLIVFVTFVISILGLFTQVVMLQAAQTAGSQNMLAQSMRNWHNGAMAVAMANPPTNASSTGCSLNPAGYQTPTVPACVPNVMMYNSTTPATNTIPGATPGTPAFYSIEYTASPTAGAATVPYVLTYIAPVDLTASGYNSAQVVRQLQRAPQTLSYGTVTASQVLTVLPRGPITAALTYTIPPTIPVGSIGIISVAE